MEAVPTRPKAVTERRQHGPAQRNGRRRRRPAQSTDRGSCSDPVCADPDLLLKPDQGAREPRPENPVERARREPLPCERKLQLGDIAARLAQAQRPSSQNRTFSRRGRRLLEGWRAPGVEAARTQSTIDNGPLRTRRRGRRAREADPEHREEHCERTRRHSTHTDLPIANVNSATSRPATGSSRPVRSIAGGSAAPHGRALQLRFEASRSAGGKWHRHLYPLVPVPSTQASQFSVRSPDRPRPPRRAGPASGDRGRSFTSANS